MTRLFRWLGSIQLAVPLLVAIAAVLGWGTLYEARFGTSAVQRFIYQAGWFHALLGFLALNLAVAALQRWPWRRRHLPFILAHIGIIGILFGGILGARLGVEGQLTIPEGESSRSLRTPQSVLLVHPVNPGQVYLFPTAFETRAWVHEPDEAFRIPFQGRTLELVVDRYYPNAQAMEEILPDAPAENPAVHLRVGRGEERQDLWLFSRDPARFGASWGGIHLLFLEGRAPAQWARLKEIGLPPHSAALMKEPGGKLFWIFTGERGQRRTAPFEVGRRQRHPWLELEVEADRYWPQARLAQGMTNRDDEVRAEALRITAHDGQVQAQAWVPFGGSARMELGSDSVYLEYRKAVRELPFEVKLIDFRKTNYPGTEMAAGFESDVELTDPERGVTLKRTIRMNNPLKYRGYTLFQSSFIQGPEGEATVLSVRNDPGTPLVYGGFLIVLAGIITLFLSRRGSAVGGAAALLIGLAVFSAGSAAAETRVTLPSSALEQVRHLAVQHNGRVKPLDSFAWEALDRLTGDPRWGGGPPVETILSMMADPQGWQEEKILSVPFVPLREGLGLGRKESHVSYARLVEERKLMRMLPEIVQKQQAEMKLSMLENETMELYDRFVLITEIFQRKLPLVPPALGGQTWVTLADPQGYSAQEQKNLSELWEGFLASLRKGESAAADRLAQKLETLRPAAYPPRWRLRLEVLYNDLAPFRVARVLYGLAALFWLSLLLAGKRRSMARAALLLFSGAFLLHGAGILTRVILGGRPPVSNFYETTLWLPFVAVVLAAVFERIYRSGAFGFAGSLLAALALLLADHLPLDPSISPVVAVLRSNLWLSIHVLTVVGSYAPLALAMVLAHLYGFLYMARGGGHPALESLALFLYRAIQVGVVLLACGIMLGAVWANASWGRYWGWDPKETWALITLLWFLAILHGRFAGWLTGVGIALSTIFGFFLLLMTYYGVSFYLVGLHSYAGGSAKPVPPLLVAYLVGEAVFMAAVGVQALRGKSEAA